MKELIIREYMAKEIKDALRQAARTFDSKKEETCMDRTIMKAMAMIDAVLEGREYSTLEYIKNKTKTHELD